VSSTCPPHANPPQPPLFARVLTEEHRRAQHVKSHTRILVCMSNPPYNREQDETGETGEGERKGGWVRYGDPHTPDDRPILQDFIAPATAAGAGVHVKNLYNDYVYFWRWALWKLFENPEANGPGIISFITASSYLRNRINGLTIRAYATSFSGSSATTVWYSAIASSNCPSAKRASPFCMWLCAVSVGLAVGVAVGWSDSGSGILCET
jgi:hypothetical protein